MRKKLLIAALLSLLILPLSAGEFCIGYDLMSFDFLWNKDVNARVCTSYRINENTRLSLSVSYGQSLKVDNQINALEGALSISYYLPSLYGLYVSASLVDAVFLFGLDAPSREPLLLTRIGLGYDLTFVPYCSFDLSISVYDAFRSSESAYSVLLSSMRHYQRVQIAFLVSARFEI